MLYKVVEWDAPVRDEILTGNKGLFIGEDAMFVEIGGKPVVSNEMSVPKGTESVGLMLTQGFFRLS